MSLSRFEFDDDRTCIPSDGLSVVELNQNFSPFEQSKRFDASNNEYWLARELQPLLGYSQWRQFDDCVNRAKLACQNSGEHDKDHFADARKLIKVGKGGVRELQDYRLSRYGCYLTAMNGDPRKSEIAAAQTYFAVKTREAEVFPTQTQEIEFKKLELELIRSKQHYQDTGYAIALSTSLAMLRYFRGDAPPPKEVERIEHFVDPLTGKEVGSVSGKSLTQLIADAGLNPKSTRDRNRVKKILKCCGMDYDQMQQWSTASYLRKYPVLEDEVYDQALSAVLGEFAAGDSQPNLFVHQMQQAALNPRNTTQFVDGVDQ